MTHIKPNWIRLDYISVINYEINDSHLSSRTDCEWDEQYLCYWIETNGKTHHWLLIQYGDIFS